MSYAFSRVKTIPFKRTPGRWAGFLPEIIMANSTERTVQAYLLLGVVVWGIGAAISSVFAIPLWCGIVAGIVLLWVLPFAIRLAQRSKPTAAAKWDEHEAEPESAEQIAWQREAEERAARAKWHAYYGTKTMGEVANMTGNQFEEFLARLFDRMGYTDIRLTPVNDQGGDLLCTSPGGERIVIQAKRWSGSVGNSAVQELLGAMLHYQSAKGMAVTNSTYTPAARELASKDSRITLLDGRWLAEQIEKFLPPIVPEFTWEEYNRLVQCHTDPRAAGIKKGKSRRHWRRR